MSSFRLGRTPSGQDLWGRLDQHTLVSGASGFGKSYVLQSALAQVPRSGWQLAGFDPTGVLFNAVGEELGGASLRAMTLADPTEVLRVMDGLVTEMDSRIGSLLEEGLDKFVDFDDRRPRVLILVEEFVSGFGALQTLDQASGVKPSERLEPRIRADLVRLTLEGRKVGMTTWLATQRADASFLSGILRSQLVQKVTMNQDSDGLRMIHDGITSETVQRVQGFSPGHGLLQRPGVPGFVEFQADVIDYATFRSAFAGRGHPPQSGASGTAKS